MIKILSLLRNSCLLFTISLLCSPAFLLADVSDDDCMECHGDATKVKTVFDADEVGSSAHKDLECVECHESITKKGEHDQKLPKVNCGECHDEEEAAFKESIHGITKVAEADEDIQPSCVACHGTHKIYKSKNSKSSTNPLNLSKTCAQCHTDKRVLKLVSRRSINSVENYEHSIHNQPQKDNPKKLAATCADCHSAHDILGPANPKSSINKFNVPKTCGKCHEKESKEFDLSVHWKSLSIFGHSEAPVCNDCHGEHQAVVPGQDPGDTAEQTAMASSQLCANCHSNRILMSRFGLDARRFESYMKTYHGMAALRGSPKAAYCVSCHEVHSIREQSDPLSSVNTLNLRETCSQCHKNANEAFVTVAVHPLNQQERNPVAYWIRVGYITLILFAVLGMLLHNGIIIWHHFRIQWKQKKSQPLVTRFSTFQIVQHLILLVSFSTLALTGFALTFPDAWWVNILSLCGLNESSRSLVHRIAAVILVASSIIQVVYFMGSKAGRKEVVALIPRWQDVVNFWNTMRYYTKGDVKRPKSGRYDYAEKVEYLALIWGMIIMAGTGFVLWFPEFFMQFMPVWAFEVSEVIHFFEALLAVLAIVVWHLFFTVLHPEKYPMNTTWLDGKVTEEEEKHHRTPEE